MRKSARRGEIPVMWWVMMTFSMFQRGWQSGSGSGFQILVPVDRIYGVDDVFAE
ncbi:uncharacterized protein METZ01_LOCUS236300 [marine metagenome]|uniref:Uncharacterized protein n=1 Tax=marine metagenome TaxID=408172 RepID=A0A382H830_9ZZZZ